MTDTTNKKSKQVMEIDQTLTIPKGWFIYNIDLDDDPPLCTIANDETGEERKIDVPSSLVYYLTTHHCGSDKMRTAFIEMGRREARHKIKEAIFGNE